MPLDALPDAGVRFDEERLVLELRVAPQAFEPTVVLPGRRREAEPSTVAGAFVDYDVSVTAGRGVREGGGGLFEAGVFGAPGVLTSSLAVRDVPDHPEAVRLETTFVRDFPERRTTLRIGDSLSRGGSFAGSVRFFGLQYGTDFSLDPYFVTFPLPAIGGLAEERSVVEVLIDNIRQASGEVPPGPFSFGDVPVLTGAGEVQLRVKDLLGRERLVTQRYYVSSRLLRAGLADWSVEAGFLRRRYGESSFAYGDPFAAGTVRYGFTDALTGELHGEWQPGRAAAVAGATVKLGTFGVLTGALGASTADGPGSGVLAELGYEYASRPFDLGLRTRYTSPDFRQSGDRGEVRRVDEARLGIGLGPLGRLGLHLVRRDMVDAEDTLSGTLSWSLPLGRGSLLLNAAKLFEPRSDMALSVHYALPLGDSRLVSGGLDVSDRSTRARASFRQGRGAGDLGLDWRIAAEAGDDVRRLDGRAEYQGRLGRIGGLAELTEDGGRVRLDLDGSLAYARGRLLASRRIGRAFGLVSLPGLPGVRVYLDHREVGRTDEDGFLLVPGLRPYEDNRLQLALEDLPLGVTVERPEVVVSPVRGGAVLVDFGVRREREATARLLASGSPLPAGLELVAADGRARALVGRDGFAHLRGLGDAPVTLEGGEGPVRFRCTLHPPAGGDPMPDLGEVACESVESS
ncbi:F1 capsule-anchoring protein [bacterium HR39]|nr:F1 capsule-anchoring protein [bacterium HR39]